MAEIPNSRPTENIEFANIATNITPTTVALQKDGWAVGDIIPSAQINWLYRYIAEHITHLEANARRTFDNLFDAIEALKPGARFVLDPASGSQYLETSSIAVSGAASIEGIATDALHLYVLDSNGDVRAYPNDGSASPTAAWSITPLNGSLAGATIATDGATLIFAGEGSLGAGYQAHNAKDGSLDELRQYVVGSLGGGMPTRTWDCDAATDRGERWYISVHNDTVGNAYPRVRMFGSTSGQVGPGLLNEDSAFAIKFNEDATIIYMIQESATAMYVTSRSWLSPYTPTTLFTHTTAVSNPYDARMLVDKHAIYFLAYWQDGSSNWHMDIYRHSKSDGAEIWSQSLTFATASFTTFEDLSFEQSDKALSFIDADGKAYILSKDNGEILGTLSGLTVTGQRFRACSDGESFFFANGNGNVTRARVRSLPSEWLRTGDGFNDTVAELNGVKQGTARPRRLLALPISEIG